MLEPGTTRSWSNKSCYLTHLISLISLDQDGYSNTAQGRLAHSCCPNWKSTKSSRNQSPSWISPPSLPRDKIMWDPYETTMKHEYPYREPVETEAVRPRTSKGHVNPYQLSDPIGFNTYREEFCWKPYSKAEPIMTGSSSGTRRNNPHPSQVYKLKILFLCLLTGKKKSHILQQLSLGIITRPQPASMTSWTFPVNMDVMQTGIFQQKELNQENIKQMTTYQRDFGKEYFNIISILNSLDPEQVNKYIERAPKQERAILQHFLNKVCGSQSEKFRRTSPSKKLSSDKLSECK
ncbi:testis-expressed protein 26 isoform X2 [Trachemys scripta elegans]|uniref:testis-expressed protein 26 isoform X2 n=1 Tax=Trachemys scripta elegans TaxID=31138 RepID=UPI0015552646|nr:testis-expressed protein 26 isoform X2 [Trachemys scripta elegans]